MESHRYFDHEDPSSEDLEEFIPAGEDYSLREIEAAISGYLDKEIEEPEGIPLPHLEEIHNFFTMFKVEDLESVNQESIEALWEKFAKDPYLVEDFTLIVADRLRTVRQSYLEKVSFSEIQQYAAATPRPQEVRRYLVETAAPNIVSLGIDNLNRMKYYEIAQSEKRPKRARAARLLGWLIGQPPMDEFKHAINQAKSEGRELALKNVAALATLEVMNRQRQHELRREKAYSMDIPAERQAYEDKRDILEAYRALCESFLLGLPTQT